MSNDAKWTPGPWVAMNGSRDIFGPLGGDSGDGWAADDTDGWMVAEVGSYPTLCEGQLTELGEECRRANAHLIAAAPELYSELCKARHAIQALISEGYMGYVDLRSSIDAVLAKARGEQS